ncbi:hypothetical protein ACA910_010687 [Epithemia clementina (nom. ined.)]
MTKRKCSTFITNSPANLLWFKHFMDGYHERMGDVKVQDTALSINVLLGIQEMLEETWAQDQTTMDATKFFELATTSHLVTCGFSSGLYREELGHI